MQDIQTEAFQLSPQQLALWFTQQQRGTLYSQILLSLEGALDSSRLQQSFQKVQQRHTALRTTYQRIPGMRVPLQVVAEQELMFWNERILSAGESLEVQGLLIQERAAGLNLEQGPVCRALLVQQAPQQYVFLITIPALNGDTVSLQNLVRELFSFYAQSAYDELEEPIQYTDVASWQQQLLCDEDGLEERAFWQRYPLPTDLTMHWPFAPLHQDKDPKADNERLVLSVEQIQALDKLAERYETSVATILLACWQTLLWYTGAQLNCVVGQMFDGRIYAEFARAIGLFAKCIPIASPLQNQATFEDLLKQLHQTLEEITNVQEYFPGEPGEIAEHNSSIPEIGFEYIEQETSFASGTLNISIIGQSFAEGLFRFALTAVRTEQRIELCIYRDHQAIPWHIIISIREYLSHLIQQVSTEPTVCLDQLSLLNEAQKRAMLALATEEQPTRTVPPMAFQRWFEQQVEQTPEASALTVGGERISYADFNARANQVASLLQQRGIGPEQFVGICFERSLHLFLAMLGVMKTGAAYVPLEPGHPRRRLAEQIQLTQMALLLSDLPGSQHLPSDLCPVLLLDQDGPLFEAASRENLTVEVRPEHPVYVIFTSGSTGTPKGVIITHQNLVNYTAAILAVLPESQTRNFASVSTLSADLGGTVVFPSLVSGGCLHVLSYETATSASAFFTYLATEQIDILKIVPSHLQTLLASQQEEVVLPRQALFLGGEAFRWEFWKQLQQIPHRCRIFNHYGPTETTIGVMLGCVDELQELELWTDTLPLGRPLAGARIYLLDSQGQPVPIGKPGEIFIGGPGVAQGYIARPDLTRERFVPDPFSQQAHQYLYRTGDLARWLPDGKIEFLTRIDNQVKVRGFRVELGEIEAVLRQLDWVRSAFVLAQRQQDEHQLIAFVVPHQEIWNAGGHENLLNQAQHFMRERLPEYFCPHLYCIEAFPLTVNGKIDQSRLLELVAQQAAQQRKVAPRTSTEELLASIWSSVLGISSIGIHDNFFALGGHSLLITQVLARINTTFQINIPVRLLFDAPTIAELMPSIESARHKDTPIPELEPASRAQRIPLSYSQQRLWFFDQLEPGSALYTMPLLIVHIDGELNREALWKAAQRISERHEILRTTFAVVDGEPAQIIHPELPLPVLEHSLLNLTSAEQAQQLDRLIVAESRRAFDLQQGPLWHLTLIQCSAQTHTLLLAMHHIISDGWSLRLLMREFLHLYEALAEHHEPQLESLPIQYADYALWQRNWLQGEALEGKLAYWRKQLAGIPDLLHLPIDRPRPTQRTFQGANHLFDIPEHLFERITQLCQQENVTLYMFFLATFQILLARLTSQYDIVVGSPVANRLQVKTEALIGIFINTLALRTDLSGQPSFQEVLKRVRTITLDAYDHQDLPFEKVVDALLPQRSLSHTPLFQVLLVFNRDHAPDPEVDLTNLQLQRAGLTWRYQSIGAERSRFDLSLINEDLQGRTWSLEYNTDIFEAATTRRMVTHFLHILESIVTDPGQPITRLPLLSLDEQQQLLIDWNPPRLSEDVFALLPALIATQAAATPQALALRDLQGEMMLSYEELDQRANQLAHYLQSQGVGPESRVGICLERTPWLVIALLAVLKAGGAYVPLNPLYPPERLHLMVENAHIEWMVTRRAIAQAGRVSARQNILLEDLEEQWRSLPLSAPASSVHLDNAAYIIYTSGSTGRPKGVVVSQRNVASFFAGIQQHCHAGEQDTLLAVTGISFDIALLELLWPLTVGACILIADEQSIFTPALLLEVMRREQVTLFQCTPSFMRLLLLEEQAFTALKNLRFLLVGGETLPSSLARQLLEHLPHSLMNMYGPTETTIWSSVEHVTDNTVTIGRPLANTQIYLCDQYLQPVPIGVVGELLIGGVGVSRGYWQRPDLTAERFIPNSFSQQPGERLYSTGDLARYRPDGRIEFLGRIDHQVKVRGFRIELEEIEHALLSHPALREAAAQVYEKTPGDGDYRLVAYVVGQNGELDMDDVRIHIQRTLPFYMHPSLIVPLSEFPLTLNGKVDRKALPLPAQLWRDEQYEPILPATDMQRRLADIWSHVLGVESIDIHDNFFDIGGDSILAVRLVSAAHQAGLHLAIKEMFEFQTIGSLAEILEQRSDEPGSEDLETEFSSPEVNLDAEEWQHVLDELNFED
ncbi:MAG TPA: amino acid adenylation domain-containing protein [Ktedonobacteraceae bacterium]|nr:amino acid adenylation domain-containing protein [Ktedonobacteraceae bacterium]